MKRVEEFDKIFTICLYFGKEWRKYEYERIY